MVGVNNFMILFNIVCRLGSKEGESLIKLIVNVYLTSLVNFVRKHYVLIMFLILNLI